MYEGDEERLHPTAYASRTCNEAPNNYSIPKLEALGPQVFQEGHIFKDLNLSRKFTKWILTIQDFDLQL